MILITRPSQPPVYAERAALGQTALEVTAAEGEFKAQRRYDFDSSIWLAALEVLRGASYDKCAYCESQSGSTGPADIDHYRPKHRAEGLRKGEIHPDHYGGSPTRGTTWFLLPGLHPRQANPVPGDREATGARRPARR
jgi:hypothetical protein